MSHTQAPREPPLQRASFGRLFGSLGSVAFHKLTDDKPLMPRSRLASRLMWHSIRQNPTNCQIIFNNITALELAARKSLGIGRVLQEVFREVQVDLDQMDFWIDLLHKARKDDATSGAMILSLLHAFCFRENQPLVPNQNIIMLKMVLAPESEMLEHVRVQKSAAGLQQRTRMVISHAISGMLDGYTLDQASASPADSPSSSPTPRRRLPGSRASVVRSESTAMTEFAMERLTSDRLKQSSDKLKTSPDRTLPPIDTSVSAQAIVSRLTSCSSSAKPSVAQANAGLAQKVHAESRTSFTELSDAETFARVHDPKDELTLRSTLLENPSLLTLVGERVTAAAFESAPRGEFPVGRARV